MNPLEDIKFLEKRIKEQEEELNKHSYSLDTDRGRMMYDSALSQLYYFKDALSELNNK